MIERVPDRSPPLQGCESAPGADQEVLSAVVQALATEQEGTGIRLRSHRGRPLPSRDRVVQIVEELRSVLFPGYFGRSELSQESLPYHLGATLDRVHRGLHEQLHRGLCFHCACRDDDAACQRCVGKAQDLTHHFLRALPEVRRCLLRDAEAAYKGDPAARSVDEAIFCYPGLLALTHYRIAHQLYALEVPLIPRIITEHAHSVTGIDIHPGARIGESFFIDHGTGVVIGETAVIGDRVRLYQGVTLGAKSFPLDEAGRPIKGIPRHPIVEDDVVIYSGATILGRVTIGRGAEIGGNAWLTRDVPAGARVAPRQPRPRVLEVDD